MTSGVRKSFNCKCCGKIVVISLKGKTSKRTKHCSTCSRYINRNYIPISTYGTLYRKYKKLQKKVKSEEKNKKYSYKN